MSQVLVLFRQRAFGDEGCAPRLQRSAVQCGPHRSTAFRPVDLSPASA